MTADGDAAPYLGAGPDGGFARWLRTADKVRLRAVFWPLDGARGTVLILPGRTEHAEKYGPVAVDLARAGFACAAIDWRGQGLADRLLTDPLVGHVGRFADYQTDLATLLASAELAGGQPGLAGPRFLLAHSMGGAIGLRALVQGLPVAAAAFSAPMWGIVVPKGREPAIRRLSGLACRLGFGARYAPPPASGARVYLETAPFVGNMLTTDRIAWDFMRRQIAERREIALAGPSLSWLHQALVECHALRALPSPAVPTLTGLGSQERIVDTGAIVDRMNRWPDGKLLRIEGAEHEILMEAKPLRDRFLMACVAHFHRYAP